MRKRRTNIDGLCDALNEMGVRTTNLNRAVRTPGKARILRKIEKARRRALKEIYRISANAKQLSSQANSDINTDRND